MQATLSFKFKKTYKQKTNIFVKQRAEAYIIDVCSTPIPDKVFIITDSAVAHGYAIKIENALNSKLRTHLIAIPATETQKDLNTLYSLSEEVAKYGATNKSIIIAIGGGIIGNISGMLAGLLFRGIRLIHIPTTLLSQLDSAADVKQSVNSTGSKNLLGIYYAPAVVVIDVIALKTLPLREIRSGLAESLKHGLAQDESLIDFITENVILEKIDIDILEQIVSKTLSLKIQHWQETPHMWNDLPGKKPERLTHLGHTVGKVIETLQKDRITHGEAISHGMIIEAMCAHKLGIGNRKVITKMKTLFEKFQLLYPIEKTITSTMIIDSLYGTSATLRSPLFALLREVGNPDTVSTSIPRDTLEKILLEYGFKK